MQSPQEPQREEPLFLIDRRPDRLELIVRAVCGGLFGLVLATYLCFRALQFELLVVIIVFAIVVPTSAYLAAKYGDRYWEALANQLRRH